VQDPPIYGRLFNLAWKFDGELLQLAKVVHNIHLTRRWPRGPYVVLLLDPALVPL